MQTKLGLIWVMLVLASVGCRDLTVPPPPPAETFISGRVVVAVPGTDQSHALQGADISVLGSNVHVVSDALGGFTVGPLPAGEYQLYAVAHGEGDTLHQRMVSGVRTTRGATRTLSDLSLAENAQLGGRVLINEQALGNAGIVVFVPGTDFATNTTDTGGWLLKNLPAGNLRASAFRSGFAPATTADVDVQGGVVTSTADLLLFPEAASAPRGRLSGTVVVMGASDSAGVRVAAISSTTQREVAAVQTDATGAFRLVDLPADLYTLTASLAGYASLRVPNLAIGGGVDLALAGQLVLAPPGAANTASDGGLGAATYVDAGVHDAGAPDAGAQDAGTDDAGSTDAGGTDAGSTDAGSADAGSADAGRGDAGQVDAGLPDAGVFDGGFIGECLTEAQCAAGLLCINHACVNCTATTTCAAGSSCHGGLCLRDCASNVNCADGQVCHNGSCGLCLSSAECQDPALVCDSTGACVHCQNRSQCPSGKACLATGCGTCTLDVECGPGSLCEAGVCLTGNCHTNQGCATTQACVGNSCQACGQDTDCRTGQLCLAGACVVGNCRGVADCAAGQLCRNNLCGACATDTDCGAGNLCLATGAGLRCQPGVCRVNADCTGSAAGEVCNGAHQCVPCAQTSECADATKVCNPGTARCVTGNCGTSADCSAQPGFVCTNNLCGACTTDTQCNPGQLCITGRCKTASCKDNTWCSGGAQLCELTTTNATASQYTCRPCTALSTINNVDCGGTGRVCTPAGTCRTGNCATIANCTGAQAGLACVNNTCSACSADADCGGNGLLCVNSRCLVGTCHGTGADPNVDCAATQTCVGNLCVGNCRGNADCAGTVANPGTNWCDSTTHSCVPCTSTNQCGGAATGKVCAAGSCQPGACTVFGATPNDTPCPTGLTCVANQCLQVGPLPLSSTPYTEPLPVQVNSSWASMVVSSASSKRLYLSGIDSAGTFSLAMDASRAKVWRVADSIGNARTYGPQGAGMVLPAPGYPMDELFLSPSGVNTTIAHRADNGAAAWSFAGSTYGSAVSMVGGVPQFARADNMYGFSSVFLARADGTKQRSVGIPACGGNLNGVVGGTKFVYALCYNAVYAIDPINDVIAWVFPVTLSNSTTYPMVWRPPGLTGAAAGDLLVTTASGGGSTLLGLFVPDNTGGPVAPTARINFQGYGSVSMWPVIDATGAVYLYLGGSTPRLNKVSLIDGSTLATVTLPVTPTTMNLAGDGTLVVTSGIGGGLYALSGITITNGSPGSATLKWQVGSATFSVAPAYPAFSNVAAIGPDGGVVDGGVVDIVTVNSLGQATQVAALAAPGASFSPSPPMWGVVGDPGNRATVPAYDCATVNDCAPLQQCVLNRCLGTCRSADDCAIGQGCSLANCGPCLADSACRAGEVCNAGACVACDRATNPACCSFNSDCGTGACVLGQCRASVNVTGTGTWLKALTPATTTASPQVQGTDGTLYVVDGAGPQALHAFASDGTPLWTSPAAPSSLSAVPMLVRVGSQDVLFAPSTTNNIFLTAVVSAASFGGWKSVTMTGITASVSAMAQGMTTALGPLKPAVYMSGAGKVWALDPGAAALGNFSLIWQQPNTGCTEPTPVGGTWLLVGSDATVYHVCSEGTVQAWHPDGQVSQPLGIARPGALLWSSTPAVPYSTSPAPRAAIAKVPSSATDVLYLSQAAALGSSVLRVSAAGAASRTEVPVNGNVAFLVDAQANAVALSTNSTQNYAALSPTGQVLGSQLSTLYFSVGNPVMTSDGLVWFIDSRNTPYVVVAMQVNSLPTPTQAMRFLAPGGLAWDSNAWFSFVPLSQSVTGSPMVVLDTGLTGLGYTTRMLQGLPVSSGGATLTQWGTLGGDAQHRASLKTQ